MTGTCYHFSIGHNLPVSRIVIHGTVSATRVGGAQATAAYFGTAGSGGSAQYVVDPGEVISCASDDTICWHAPPNRGSLGVEFCDWVNWARPGGKTVADVDPVWAGQSEADFNRRWSLSDWDDMLRLGAKLVHDRAVTYRVPLARIGAAQLLAGGRGICGHLDVSEAWHQSDHTDPGPSFPWDLFMRYVGAAPSDPSSYPPPPLSLPAVVPLPGVLSVDGGLGPATIRRWQQVMGTPADGAISRPVSSLVSAVQTRLNKAGAHLAVDGAGIVQDGRVYQTVAALQRFLATPADGKLSLPDSSAVRALQVRLNQGHF